jgi:hypothetical protein
MSAAISTCTAEEIVEIKEEMMETSFKKYTDNFFISDISSEFISPSLHTF